MEQSTLEASHTLYQMQESGNCYKIRLLMKQLDLPVNLVPVDITRGESRTDDFLEKNINGRVPVLELPDGSFLAESNAILWYLAEGSRFVPSSTIDRARVLQWMFFEQYSHEPFIATSRYWISILGEAEKYARELEQKRPTSSLRDRISLLETVTQSQISHCLPTPMLPMRAILTSRPTVQLMVGSRG
jgi:glutathione S-transferase